MRFEKGDESGSTVEIVASELTKERLADLIVERVAPTVVEERYGHDEISAYELDLLGVDYKQDELPLKLRVYDLNDIGIICEAIYNIGYDNNHSLEIEYFFYDDEEHEDDFRLMVEKYTRISEFDGDVLDEDEDEIEEEREDVRGYGLHLATEADLLELEKLIMTARPEIEVE